MNIKEKINQLASDNFNEIIEIRRHLHKFPELSFHESETSKYLCSKLDLLKIPYKTGYAKYGIIADIKGKPDSGKMVALRADMDALAIDEKNTFHFKSVNEGVMHACGHDVHMASLLGTAKILNELKDHWAGKVRLIFQPAEEKIPGGAKQMLQEGIFKDQNPDYVIAQHVDPTMETGKIGIRSGMYMASTDEIYLTITGKGGHAAIPDKITDTVLSAANIITGLQQIVSRKANPIIPTVLSFGKIIANGATNIIPDKVYIDGTFRTFNESWRKEAHQKIKKISQEIAAILDTECEVEVLNGYPFLVNDAGLTDITIVNAKQYLGIENVENLELRMTSEDFSYFSQKYPSVLYRLGCGNHKKQAIYPLHSDKFNVDEDAIIAGMGFMAYNAIMLLK
ncbi:MAG: M20 family metallopeptidase [Bacteroidota bacterium]